MGEARRDVRPLRELPTPDGPGIPVIVLRPVGQKA
jgi:hypothetical protein